MLCLTPLHWIRKINYNLLIRIEKKINTLIFISFLLFKQSHILIISYRFLLHTKYYDEFFFRLIFFLGRTSFKLKFIYLFDFLNYFINICLRFNKKKKKEKSRQERDRYRRCRNGKIKFVSFVWAWLTFVLKLYRVLVKAYFMYW